MPQVSSTFFPPGMEVGLFTQHPNTGVDPVETKQVPEEGMVEFDVSGGIVGSERWIGEVGEDGQRVYRAVRVLVGDGPAINPRPILAETRPADEPQEIHTGARSTVTARGRRRTATRKAPPRKKADES